MLSIFYPKAKNSKQASFIAAFVMKHFSIYLLYYQWQAPLGWLFIPQAQNLKQANLIALKP